MEHLGKEVELPKPFDTLLRQVGALHALPWREIIHPIIGQMRPIERPIAVQIYKRKPLASS